MKYMSPKNPDWDDFIVELASLTLPILIEECPEDEDVETFWKRMMKSNQCDNTFTNTVDLLREAYGYSFNEIEATLRLLQSFDGTCDCEVILNIDWEVAE